MNPNQLYFNEEVTSKLESGGLTGFIPSPVAMGLDLIGDGEEDICRRGEKMYALVESLTMNYTGSVNEALRDYQVNFVISDPRLPENPIVYANEGFCKMSGYSREEVLGRNCRFLQGPDTDRRTVLELRDAIQEERSAQVRILNYTKQGKPFWNMFHLAPVFSHVHGTVIHFVGVQTPISCELAAFLPDKGSVMSPFTMDSEPSQKIPLAIGFLSNIPKDWDGVISKQECPRADARKRLSDGFSHSESKAKLMLSSSGKDMHGDATGTEQDLTIRLRIGGLGVSDSCNPQGPESLKGRDAVDRIVSQLVESSKGKGGVVKIRGKQLRDCTATGVVSSSLMLSLTRIQQSFVLANPHLPNAPIVHASDLFLHLTGYNREEVLGRNCRFLQGPGTDPVAVAELRECIRLEKSCSVRLLNYRKDKRPFWNLLHVSPVRSSRGQVAFYVGVQLQVSTADEEEESTGMSACMKQLGAVGAVRVAVRSLQGAGLRRTIAQ